MGFKLLNPGVIFVSSVLSLFLTFFKVSITTYQQIVVILMVVLLVLYNAFSKSQGRGKLIPPYILVAIIISTITLFVQLLLISTGGLLSPFLILIHLVTLASSFLINFRTSLSFFFLTLGVLAVNALLNQSEFIQIQNDPGTVLLYLVSFLIILPLSHLVTSKYHLKEELSKVLSQQVQVEESIIESVNELVLVTDKSLKVISANEALEKILNISKTEIEGKSFFDALNLKDPNGLPATLESLSVDRVLEEKATRIVSGFYLYTRKRQTPFTVSVQVKPVTNPSGEISQLSFVFTEGKILNRKDSGDSLEKAKNKEQYIIDQFKRDLHQAGITKLDFEVELLEKTEKDIQIAQEIKDHPIRTNNNLVDIAEITKQVVNEKRNYAASLNINLQFNLSPIESREMALLNLKSPATMNGNLNNNLPISDFIAMTDPKWVKILIEKIVDIAILLSFSQKKIDIQVTPLRENKQSFSSNKTLTVEITTALRELFGNEDDLYQEYYSEELNSKTNLKFGSGLEGFIARTISTQLNIPIKIKPLSYAPILTFVVLFNSKPE